jgi:hypothetical protein
MLAHPTVLTRICRLPVEVLGSERPGLVEWIIIRDMDSNEDRVEFSDLVCLEGTERLWRYILFVNRLRQIAATNIITDSGEQAERTLNP